MIAANRPVQRRAGARLLVIDAAGAIRHTLRSSFVDLLGSGDLVVANDAAVIPASLHGEHLSNGALIEVRLAGRGSLEPGDMARFSAVVFGSGDFRTRTEDRPPPPPLAPGDRLRLGPLSATVEALLDHPRYVMLRFDGDADDIWAGLARHGRPIQYAHIESQLRLWDVWTPIAGPPAAFEPPSAGFAIDWRMLASMRSRGVDFATLTHAAGISSTGDESLDRRLPFDEPYYIPAATAYAVERARARGGRVIATGTTVVRALEDAALCNGRVRIGAGMATNRIGASTQLCVVDAILSGTHEPGTSHYELLRAFADDAVLRRADEELDAHGYLTHEFGDSVLIERRVFSGASAGGCRREAAAFLLP
jgi:S-adenosylmethionine:tRNA ribosyltransferase-isomerase